MSHRSSRQFLAFLTILTMTGLALTGCGHAKKTPPEQVAAQAYLEALGSADAAGAAARTTDSVTAAPAISRSLAGLGTGVKGSLTVTGLTDRQSSTATASYQASWQLPGVATPWKYTGSLPVIKQGQVWLVSWKSSDIQPALPTGSHLSVQRSQPTRAPITDDHGSSLFTPTPVVQVGINPAAVTNLGQLASALAAVPQLQTTVAEIVSAVKAAPKNQFVPIITLRRPAYEQIKPLIYNLPGTAFPTGTLLLPPTSDVRPPTARQRRPRDQGAHRRLEGPDRGR